MAAGSSPWWAICCTRTQPGYNPRYDSDSDGYIDAVGDIGRANSQFGASCPRFVYDANGNLTKLEGPKRMVYIGGIYEKNLDTGEVTCRLGRGAPVIEK
jgi:hypothetical protein